MNTNIPKELSELSIDDPTFSSTVFNTIAKGRKTLQFRDGDNLRRVAAEEFEDLSIRLDSTNIQDSTTVRNILRTRRLANLLISDKGELISSLLPRIIGHLNAHLHSLGPERNIDSRRQEHILKVLKILRDNKDIIPLLRRISKPLSHPLAEQIIRETLQLPSNVVITDAHAKRAALAAWMCFLRQNIGSCFASAPAIIIHDEQPELFLTDLYDLLGTGRLKRIVSGIEYSAPLSTSWGTGDLRKPFIITQEIKSLYGEVWNSPGLIAALEAAELLQKEDKSEAKIEKTKEYVLFSFPEIKQYGRIYVTNMEEILRRILLHHLGLTQQDLDAYAQRPKGMIHTGLLMQAPVGSSQGGKGGLCNSFFHLFEAAASAFKGLTDNALLRSWEYTVASFADTKSDFTRWNLYASLGLHPEKNNGIGQRLYQVIKDKLDKSNQKLAEMQTEYENVYAVIKQLEVRIRHASSDKEASWIQAEYQSKAGEFHTFEEMRNKEHAKAGLFVRLFDILIDLYDKLFPVYFQEVYDADLLEGKVKIFDDSPAGFRLLFKHGRSNTSQWTKITNPQEFTDALSRFFMMTESEIASRDMLQQIQPDIADIVTALINHVKTTEFLEGAFQRMSQVHRTPLISDPIHNWEKIPSKPWAYISGGTMSTLVNTYYSREQHITEISRWVEDPVELLVFLADTLKHTPYSMMEEYVKNPDKSMLIHSPTHAFLLKPGLQPFRDAWTNESFSYTWIRDNLVLPMERFVDTLDLNEEMMQFLLTKMHEMVPENFKFYFKKVFSHPMGKMNSRDFRYYILDRIIHEKGLQYDGRGVITADELDRLLYTQLPLFPSGELYTKLETLWKSIPNITPEIITELKKAFDTFDRKPHKYSVIGAKGLQDIFLALYSFATGKTALHINLQQEVAKQAQILKMAMPKPIIFADTNWSKEYFAFVVSPGTGDLELWRVDETGKTGTPMSIWSHWLDGTKKDPTWGVYPRPYEYSQPHLPKHFHPLRGY